MCGIAGFLSLNPQPAHLVGKMSDLIRHRGPDDEGYLLFENGQTPAFIYGGRDTPDDVYRAETPYAPRYLLSSFADRPVHVAIGHRRLSIVDLSPLGHQPMCTADRRYWIAFNGEVYNYIELKAELEQFGYRFASHSDTEVILAAYQCWGANCLSRFNGMWAMVILDTEEQVVFLARDRFGVKPLYWWTDGTVFLFASEIKAFLAHPRFSAKPNVHYLGEYLNVGAREYLEETAFAGVRRLLHSHFVLATPKDLIAGRFQPKQWWTLSPNPCQEAYNEARAQNYANQYRELLKSAVELRLRADVRVGSALSGGLDSSSVVYLVNELLRERAATEKQEGFSSIYRTPGTEDCDESSYIRIVAGALGVHCNAIEPNEHEIPEEHEKVIWAMDTPPDNTCMSAWYTFKLVQRCGIKVTLDGQGADEQLAGYVFYLADWLHELSLGAALAQAPSLLNIHPFRKVARAYARTLASRIAPQGSIKGPGGLSLRFTPIKEGLNATLHRDTLSNLVSLIHYADRTSMAYSVESRMPFMDYRLAEMMATIPSVYKIHGGWTKMVGREAFDRLLPDSIVWRKDKMGWPIPENYWFTGSLKAWFDQQEAVGQEFCRTIGLSEPVIVVDQVKSMAQRVRLVNLGTWNRLFLDRNAKNGYA